MGTQAGSVPSRAGLTNHAPPERDGYRGGPPRLEAGRAERTNMVQAANTFRVFRVR